MLVLSQNHWS